MRPARPTRAVPALCAIALCGLLVGCGDGTPADPAAAPPAATSGTQPGAVPAALDFTAPLVGGGRLDAGGLAGQPVLFWFWAPY